MAIPETLRLAIRLPRRSLRAQLALLFAALFCIAAALVGAVAVIFKPNFLYHSSSQSDTRPTSRHGSCCQPTPRSFVGNIAYHIAHNVGGDIAAAVMVILAIGVGWLLAGWLLKPLRAIIAASRAISASNLSQRLALDGPADEFRELGDTLDDLFGRLEASFQAQRHFVANASHELRTPLAAGRTLLQVALADPDASAETLRSTCEEMLTLGDQQERLIEGLLTLASSERGVERWEPFDLAEAATKAIEDHGREAGRRGITVDADLSAALVTGDPSLAECLVSNLVDNAIRHNTDGGVVEISTRITDGRAAISVRNTGSLVPAGEVDRLFQPFQRLGAERIRPAVGHGLGLAIVHAIAGVHNATIAAQARPEGGLHIEVIFPLAAQRPGRELGGMPERINGAKVTDFDLRSGAIGRDGEPDDQRRA
jgi:signal transduction histidine kinase